MQQQNGMRPNGQQQYRGSGGMQQPPMTSNKYCHECGTEFPVAWAKFCSNCGITRTH